MACLAATSFGPDPSSRRQRPWDDLGQILGNDLGPDRVPEVVLGGDGSPPDPRRAVLTDGERLGAVDARGCDRGEQPPARVEGAEEEGSPVVYRREGRGDPHCLGY